MQQTAPSKATLRSYIRDIQTISFEFPDPQTAIRFSRRWNEENPQKASVYHSNVFLEVSPSSTIGSVFHLAAKWFAAGVDSRV